MKKFSCSVCGYVFEGDSAPDKCPQCGAASIKFKQMDGEEKTWAAEHVIGVAKGCWTRRSSKVLQTTLTENAWRSGCTLL